MALRIRSTGEILCAAHTEEQEGDTYIPDPIHYMMSVVTRCIFAKDDHEQTNLWFWNIPSDMIDHYHEIETNKT